MSAEKLNANNAARLALLKAKIANAKSPAEISGLMNDPDAVGLDPATLNELKVIADKALKDAEESVQAAAPVSGAHDQPDVMTAAIAILHSTIVNKCEDIRVAVEEVTVYLKRNDVADDLKAIAHITQNLQPEQPITSEEIKVIANVFSVEKIAEREEQARKLDQAHKDLLEARAAREQLDAIHKKENAPISPAVSTKLEETDAELKQRASGIIEAQKSLDRFAENAKVINDCIVKGELKGDVRQEDYETLKPMLDFHKRLCIARDQQRIQRSDQAMSKDEVAALVAGLTRPSEKLFRNVNAAVSKILASARTDHTR